MPPSSQHVSTSRRDLTDPVPGRAHLIGACGSGMQALAELLLDRGWKLTGSDQQAADAKKPQDNRAYSVYGTHAAELVTTDLDLVVHSAAIAADNVERLAAAQLGIPTFSYSQALGRLMQRQSGICVAGTHGKTTTTAMLATILKQSGQEPSVVVGGELIQFGRSGWSGGGADLVAESCEYRRHFLDLHPRLAAITGIEPDHFDCFDSPDSMHDAFYQFANRIPREGTLIVRGDCADSMLAARDCPGGVETFSASTSSDWNLQERTCHGQSQRFRVMHHGRAFCEIALHIPGEHNAVNALAAAALASVAGVEPESIEAALAGFEGVRRRFEVTELPGGITLVDDYAHHPTAVAATLKTARACFPDRRIICAFQPHQVLRTESLLSEFGQAFADADQVLLCPVFTARETAAVGDRADRALNRLAKKIEARGLSVSVLSSLDQLLTTVDDDARLGDVLLTLGAGDIDQVPHELTRTVRRNYKG